MTGEIIIALCIVFLFAFLLLLINSSDANIKRPKQIVKKKEREIFCEDNKNDRAIRNYQLARKRYFENQQKGRAAYIGAMQAERQKQLWRQRRQKIFNNSKRTFQEVFPEMSNPQIRSLIIRQILSQVIGRLIKGDQLTAEWKSQINEFMSDAHGVFEAKRWLVQWRSEQTVEANDKFERNEISAEEHQSTIDLIDTTFQEAMQNINM